MFKVVPDQLRVSEGWVRCGQCSEVFDANLHLQASDATAVAANAEPPSDDFLADEHAQAPVATRIDIQIPDEAPEPVVAPLAAPEVAPPVPEPMAPEPMPTAKAAVGEPFLEVNPHALYIDPLDAPDGAIPPEPVLSEELHRSEAPGALSEPIDEVADDPEPDAGEAFHHAFLKPSRVPTKPRGRWVAVALALTGGLLGVALVLQVAVRERDRIVAMEPGARAVLEPLCAAVGCALVPLRQIESVVIDSSSFTKLRGDVYRLAFTLKNTSHLPLATPALELALTDLQDQTVVRKVFLVPDFADQRAVLEPGAELPVNLPVALKLPSGSNEKIAGYRLLSFYP